MVKYVYQHNYEGRPQPTTAHRFEIQRDESIRQQLDFVRQGLQEVKIEIPEIIDATLYGSYTKGTASKKESDVDCYLFMDADQALTSNPDATVETLRKYHNGDYYVSRFNERVSRHYTSSFSQQVFSCMDKAGSDLRLDIHTMPVPIGFGIIDFHIQKALDYAKALTDHNYMRLRKENGEQDVVVDPRPISVGFGRNIPAMFHLQIGRGLNPYRKYVIDKLTQLEHDEGLGEIIWKMIINETKRYELLSIKIEKRFPETLEHARAIYCRDDAA